MPIRTAASVNGGMSCATTRVATTAPPNRLNAATADTLAQALRGQSEPGRALAGAESISLAT